MSILNGRARSNVITDEEMPFGTVLEQTQEIPTPAVQWRINFYRIDEDPLGIRQYQAWSPMGAKSFHQPSKFGLLTFLK